MAIASIIGLIGTVVGFGNVGYTWIEKSVITDDEYIMGSNSYQLTACENPISVQDTKNPSQTIQQTPTAEQIAKCKDTARTQLIDSRAFNEKNSIIGGAVWGLLFLLVFLGHFPVFFRSNRKAETDEKN